MSRHRDDVQKLQSQLGNLRQQVGVLEGNLGALRTANARYADEAAQARNQRDQLALSLTNAAAKQKVSTAKRTANRQQTRAREVARWVNRRERRSCDFIGRNSARATYDSGLNHHARGMSR